MQLDTRLFIHDLTHLDCAWFDPDGGLMGETWRVDLELGGQLDDDGMLCDFGIVKRRLKQYLDAHIDHRLLLNAEQAKRLQGQQQQSIELCSHNGDAYGYRAPADSFAIVDRAELTATSLATSLRAQLVKLLPDNVTELQIELIPAFERGIYRYCHGLQSHDGNCQRMAHGHRAQLEIRVDGERSSALETHWQQCFDQRYIGSAQHLSTSGQRHRYAYSASQGQFELELPAHRSYPIEADPTVERISAHMARQLAAQHTGHHIECKAFEGIGKGASSCAQCD